MRLEELLQVVNENKNVVVNVNGKEVSRYDGRNSIDVKFNPMTEHKCSNTEQYKNTV